MRDARYCDARYHDGTAFDGTVEFFFLSPCEPVNYLIVDRVALPFDQPPLLRAFLRVSLRCRIYTDSISGKGANVTLVSSLPLGNQQTQIMSAIDSS